MDGAIHDKQNNERFIKILWQNAQRLTQLTSDLMTLSQIEGPGAGIRVRSAAPWPTSCASLPTAFGPVLARKSLQLTVDSVHEDLKIRCDLSAVQQILSNLLDNAAKYTPAGGEHQPGG